MRSIGVVLCSVIAYLGLSWVLFMQVPAIVDAHLDIDSKAYVKRAELFAKTSDLVGHKEQLPYYPLGYPFFIGLLFKLFGSSKPVVICAQVLFGLCSIVGIFFLTQLFFDSLAACIASVFMGLNVGYLVFAQFMLSEIILSLLLLLFFFQMMRFITDYDVYDVALAGLVLGFSVLFKPAALYYPLLLIPLVLCVGQIAWVKRFKNVGAFIFAFLLPLCSYMTYNKVAHGQFYLTAMTEVNAQLWFFPHVLACKNSSDVEVERAKLTAVFNKPEGSKKIAHMMKQEFAKKPLLFVGVWFKNVMKTWVGLFSSNLKVLMHGPGRKGLSFFKQQGFLLQRFWMYMTGGTKHTWVQVIAVSEMVWSVVRYFLCLSGLCVLLRQRRWMMLVFLLSYLFYFSMITGHDGCARFRMMFEFVLILLAAGGAYELIRPRKRKRRLV
ncbi:MAG: glycosyltransferase family 39 protein [Epsilonproteobacteria bacterium]|nr:glycosyltransferase family 39 protein [Campylobacterota bacterium]